MQFEPKVVEIDPRIEDNIDPKNDDKTDDNIEPKKDIKSDAKKPKFIVPSFVKYAISALLVIILVVVFALFVIKRERENYSSAMAEIKAITDENNELKVRHTENQQLINSLNNRLQNTQHQLSEALAYKDAKQYNSESFAVPIPEVKVGFAIDDGSEIKQDKPLTEKQQIQRMVNQRRPQNSDFMNTEKAEEERRKLDENAKQQIESLLGKNIRNDSHIDSHKDDTITEPADEKEPKITIVNDDDDELPIVIGSNKDDII